MLFEGTYKMKYTLRKDSVKGVHIKSVKALFVTNIFHTVSQQNKTNVLSVKENNLYSHLLLSETISLLCFQNYLYF